jgi:hypothetical protein
VLAIVLKNEINRDSEKLIFDEYRKLLNECIDTYKSQNIFLKIKLFFRRKEYGGCVNNLDYFTYEGGKKRMIIKGSIRVGLPSRNYKEEKRALIFHEVGHLIFFSYLGFCTGCRSYNEILNFLSKHLEFVPWSEVCADFLTAKYGNLEKYILSRKFEDWKWWKNHRSFKLYKESVILLFENTNKMNIFETLDFLVNSNLSRKMMKKILKAWNNFNLHFL